MLTQDWRPGLDSAVPSGLFEVLDVYPGLASWAKFSRPFGTMRCFTVPFSDFHGECLTERRLSLRVSPWLEHTR
jgi:hypothetical protein